MNNRILCIALMVYCVTSFAGAGYEHTAGHDKEVTRKSDMIKLMTYCSMVITIQNLVTNFILYAKGCDCFPLLKQYRHGTLEDIHEEENRPDGGDPDVYVSCRFPAWPRKPFVPLLLRDREEQNMWHIVAWSGTGDQLLWNGLKGFFSGLFLIAALEVKKEEESTEVPRLTYVYRKFAQYMILSECLAIPLLLLSGKKEDSILRLSYDMLKPWAVPLLALCWTIQDIRSYPHGISYCSFPQRVYNKISFLLKKGYNR